MKKNTLPLLFVLFVFLLLAIGAFFVYKVKTNNWKVYTNSQYGFSFKYPPNYSYSSSGPNYFQQQIDSGKQISGTVAPSFDTLVFMGSKKQQNFTIGIFGVSQGDAFQQGFDGSCGTQFADKTLIDKTGLLNDIKYREVEQQDNQGINIHYCFLSGTKNLLSLSAFSVSKDNVDKTSQFLKEILLTFKFTGQNPVKTGTEEELDNNFLTKSVAFGKGKETSYKFSSSQNTQSIIKKSPTGNGSIGNDPQLYEFQVRPGDPGSVVLAESRKIDLGKVVGKKVNITYRNIIGVVYAEQQAMLIDAVSEDKKPNETANWKTYTLKNFSFSYPNDLLPEYQWIEPGSVTNFKYIDKSITPLALDVFENTQERIKTYNPRGKVYGSTKEYLQDMFKGIYNLNEVRQIIVSDQTASKISDPGSLNNRLPYQEVAFFSPDKSFIVSFFYQPSLYRPDVSLDYRTKPQIPSVSDPSTWPNPKAEPVLDQILSSFKFK